MSRPQDQIWIFLVGGTSGPAKRMNAENNFPHSANLRKYRFDASNYVYFITKRRHKMESLDLTNPPYAEILVDVLFWLQANRYIWLLGFVFMPDHIHLILAPREPHTLAQVTKSLFNFSSKKINELRKQDSSVWETEYYEHLLTGRDKMQECLEYIYLNPVRKGFVRKMEDWIYSRKSARFTGRMDWSWYGTIS